MRHPPTNRSLVLLQCLLLIAPPLFAFPVSAGTVLSHSTADFPKGTVNNTAVFADGLNLETIGLHPYNWTPLGALSPEAQWRPVFGYDAAHGMLTMTGGAWGSSRVWTYNLQSDDWKMISAGDSSAVGDTISAGAIDSINGQIVGASANASITYSFNLTTHAWADKNATTPPLVGYGYSLAFDSDRGEMVLFGGQGFGPGDSAFAETWSYNVSTNAWTNRTPTVSPPGRAYASMAYDRAGKVMVLFGGNSSLYSRINVTLLNDTWTYDLGTNAWTNRSPSNPPPVRELSGMAYDSGLREMLLFGGIKGTERTMGRDTWSYNLSRNAWTELHPNGSPPPRSAHSMAYDPKTGKTVLVGGDSPEIYNWRADSWSYDPAANNWTMGTLKAPSARTSQLVAYDSDAGEVILFGGSDRGITSCGDTWKYNVSQACWTLLSPKRACEQLNPRSGYNVGPGNGMAYDAGRKQMVLYNPQSKDPPETFAFNRSTNNWTNLGAASSIPIGYTSLAYHRTTRQMVAYKDGLLYAYLRPSNEWSQLSSATGPTDIWASLVELETTGELFVQTESGETWTYNFTNDEWTKRSLAENPADRMFFSMAYDSSRDEVLLYGGSRAFSEMLNDTWRFDVGTGTWQQMAPALNPPAIYNHQLVYIRNERETLLFGGRDQSYEANQEIWTVNRLRFTGSGNYVSPAIDLNGTAFFGNLTWDAFVPGGTGLRLQLRSGDNETALNAANFTGPDGTASTFYDRSGQEVSGIHNGSRWMQYRVFLNTTDERLGPALSGLKIYYNLIPVVNVTSPKAGDLWTGTKPIKWNATEPDRDNVTFDIYAVDSAGRSAFITGNLTFLTRSYQWDTTAFRSGSYRIKIVARDDNRTIPVEAGYLSGVFTLAHPNHPPAVELLKPVYGETVNSSSATLEWSGSDFDGDALTYTVFVGLDEFFIEYLPEAAAVTDGTSATITNLTDGAMYFWSVLASDGQANSTLPEVLMFRVHVPPPPPKNHPPEVALLEPDDNGTVANDSSRLSWSGSDADGDALTYTVFFAGAAFDLSSLPEALTVTNGTSLTVVNLTDGASYYWTVRGSDGKDNGTAPVRRFERRVVIPADTPNVVDWSPRGRKTALSPTIVVGFDREMDAPSVFTALVISPPADIAGVMRSNNTFTFTLGSPLSPETTYEVTVGTSARSSKGKNMFRPFGWNFTTLAAGEVDSELPSILLTDPLNGASGVDRWKNITIMFSEAMALTATEGACTITPAVNGSWQWMNQRGFALQFKPKSPFENGTYRVTVSSGARDESGNPLDGNGNGKADGGADNVTFSFTVGVQLTGKPRLLTKSLEGPGVRADSILVLAFDRRMDLSSIRDSFRISPAVEGNWTTDAEAKIFTFTPAKRFRAGTAYTVTIGKQAQDLEGNHVENEASWSFTTAAAAVQAPAQANLWLILVLVVVAVSGAAAFAFTRGKKAASSPGPGPGTQSAPKGFAIDDIFLMFNDGRLIQHSTRRIKADMDVDIFTSMLTALQAFVKDSMGHGTGDELGSMEFGGNKILLEKGRYVIVAVVITGGEPQDLRDEMKTAVRNIESEYGAVFKDWDGGASQLSGAKRFLSELGAYRVAEEALAKRPRADISLKSELEFYQGFVRLKVAVKNDMATFIMNATFELMFNEEALRLYSVEPAYERKGDKVVLGNIEPHEKKTVAYYLDPQICTESYLEGILTFKDAHGTLESIKMPRKLTSVVCPILFTDENINTAMLKRMVADELDKKDSKVFTIPSTMTAEKAFEVGKAAVQHHDVRLVRELREEKPFRAEAWYYGKAKGRADRLVVQVRVIPEMNFMEFAVASDSVLMLTGMLAELKTDLNKELETHHLKGAMKQVVDQDDMDAVAEIRSMLEKASEAESG